MSDEASHGPSSSESEDDAGNIDQPKRVDAGQSEKSDANRIQKVSVDKREKRSSGNPEQIHSRRINLAGLERLVSVAGGMVALVAAIVGGSVAVYHHFYPDTPWRTQADTICLRFMDDYQT